MGGLLRPLLDRARPTLRAARSILVKIVFIAFVALLILLIGAAFVVPGFINGNAYKSRIVSLAESATGRSLAISGDVSLRLLPSPVLSVQGVRLANVADAASAEMLSLDSVEVHVALWPLLRRRVEVRSVRLVEPVIELEILADGTPNWDFSTEDDLAAQPALAARRAAGERSPATVDDDGAGGSRVISLAEFEVVRGKLTFRDERTGIVEVIENLSAVFSADSLADGPYAGAGQMRMRGIPVRFDVAVGDRSRPGNIPVNAKLDASGIDASIAFRGTTSDLAGDAKVSGRVDVAGKDLRALLQPLIESGLFATSLPVLGGQPFSLKATIDGTREDLAVNEIDIRLGEARAIGALSAVLADPIAFDLTLDVGRVDLDSWLASSPISGLAAGNAMAAPRGGGEQAEGESDTAAADGGEVFVAIPDNVSGSLSLRIDALTYRGNSVRQVEISANLAGGVATINHANAQFPGGSDVALIGSAANVDGQARFDGTFEVASDDLRGVLSWLGIEVPSVPAGRLGKLSLRSSVRVTPELGQIFGIDMRLDSSRLTGGAAYAFRDRPSFSVDFAVDRLNADAYRADANQREDAGAVSDEDEPPTPSQETPTSTQVDAREDQPAGGTNRGLAILNDFDANIKVAIGALTYNETRLDGLLVDATVLGGRLTLREARVADLAGAAVSLTGAAGDFGRTPIFASNLEMTAQDPGGLFRLFDVSLPVASDRLGPIELKGTVSGTEESIELGLTTRLRNTRAKIDGTVEFGAVDERIDLSIGIVNDSFVDFASVVGFDVKPIDPDLDGRISVSGSLSGALDNLALDIRAAVQDAAFTLSGSLADLSGSPRFDFRLGAEHPELATFLNALGIPYRPSAANLGGFRIAADIAGDSTQITLTSVEGRAGPVAFDGTALADLGGARPRIAADLEMSEVLVDLFLPRVSSSGSTAARPAGAAGKGASDIAAGRQGADDGRWSTDPLDLAVLRSFDADLKISARGLIYGSYSFKEPRIKLTLDDGTLDIRPLTGKLFGGDATLNMRVEEGPILNLTANIGLTGADMERALAEAASIDRVTGRFDMGAEFTTSGQSQLDMISNLRGRAAFIATDGQLRGVDLAALSQRLDHLDQGLDVLSLILTSLSGGVTRYRAFGGSFVIDNGVARTTDLSAELEAAQGTGEGFIDIANWQIDLRTTARLTEHPRAPQVGLDLRGPLDAPRRNLRTRDLEAYLAERAGSALLRQILPRETQGLRPDGRVRPRDELPDVRDILRGVLQGVGN